MIKTFTTRSKSIPFAFLSEMLFFRISGIFFLGILALGYHTNAQTIDSLNLPKVWLRADKDTISSIYWSDYSKNKRSATSINGQGPSPTGYLNYNKAMTFDGVDDYMTIPFSFEGLSEITTMAVFWSADTTERGVWGTENAYSRNILLTTRKATGPDSATDQYGKFENLLVLNTLVQNWDENKGTLMTGAFTALGSSGKTKSYKPFKGKIAEFLIFDKVIDYLPRVKYESYLGIKYGILLKDRNYVSSANQITWNSKDNGYNNRIMGIGRDDAFSLYQKQSRAALDTAGFLYFSVGKLAETNIKNTSTINDLTFILLGDNGQSLMDQKGQGADSLLSYINRKYLVTVSGSSAKNLPTQLKVNFALLPADPKGYWMVVDRSGTSNFSIDNLEYIFPDSITTDKTAYFKNLNWDEDGSGKDNFGFVRAKDMLALIRNITNPTCSNRKGGKFDIQVIGGDAPFQFELKKGDQLLKQWKDDSTSQYADLNVGQYQLTVKDAQNREVRRVFNLTMKDSLIIDLGPDLNLAFDKNIVLDASKDIPDSVKVSYLWENNYGFKSTASKISVSESGIYKASVTNVATGCTFTDQLVVAGAKEQKLAVFPNPTGKGEANNISVSLAKEGDVVVQIYDPKGQLTKEMKGRNNMEFHFQPQMQNSGLYMVLIQTPEGLTSHKLIVY
jgi:hypothetical protein